MKGTFKVQDMDGIEVTLELTLTMSHWKRLAKQLEETKFSPYPAWQLKNLIIKLVEDMAEKLKREPEKPTGELLAEARGK